MGGLNPEIYPEFIDAVRKLPELPHRVNNDYDVFRKFNLTNITDEQFPRIQREILNRSVNANKICWHPLASNQACRLDKSGKIIVSAAHSIQNNGVLSKIVEDGHVMSHALNTGTPEGSIIGKNYASIFWGFCNTHDAIFRPIEIEPYSGTDEQHFLFAYRAFVVASHKKRETSFFMNYGEQSENDILRNKEKFDSSILSNDYSVIETNVIMLPAFYPIAVSSAFSLEFDFKGNPIEHSEERMEYIFLTLLPVDKSTYVFISYLKEDRDLYKDLHTQLADRNNLKSDLSILISSHVENVYYNPIYYKTFIEEQEEDMQEAMIRSQMVYGQLKEDSTVEEVASLTPANYLENPDGINLFGY